MIFGDLQFQISKGDNPSTWICNAIFVATYATKIKGTMFLNNNIFNKVKFGYYLFEKWIMAVVFQEIEYLVALLKANFLSFF